MGRSNPRSDPLGDGTPLQAYHDQERHSPSTTLESTTKPPIHDRDNRRRLLRKQALMLFGTAIFIAFIVATFRIYERKGNFSSGKKTTLNAILVALSLALGFNFLQSFKITARAFQAQRNSGGRKTGSTEDLGNFGDVLSLGWKSIRNSRWLVVLACGAWVLLFLLAQLSVAAISFTYTIDDGTNYNDTYITDDKVNATNFECYFANSRQSKCPFTVTAQARSHIYGELSQRTGDCASYNSIDDILGPTSNPAYYCRRTPSKQEFAYRFKEWNPQDTQSAYPSFSNRIITVSSGECFEYDEVDSAPARDQVGNMAATKYTYGNATFNSTIVIPEASEGLSGTTYVYRGKNIPKDATTFACGPRCILMFAYKSQGPNEKPKFYECPITVSRVTNQDTDEHEIPNDVARLAAASIAMQGRWAGTFEDKIWTQYQFYAASTTWEIHGLTRDEVGAAMAEFALGSIATMAELNPRLELPGRKPYLGSRLRMFENWHSITGLLVSIFGVHAALTLYVAWAAIS